MIHVKAFVIGLVIGCSTFWLLYLIATGPKIVTNISTVVLFCLLSYGIGRAVLEEDK